MGPSTLLVQLPSASPIAVNPGTAQPCLCIRHPGYRSLPDNVLLNLPAIDPIDVRANTFGLRYRTVLTTGAIIANNAFDRAYLAFDQAGSRPMLGTMPLDGILLPGHAAAAPHNGFILPAATDRDSMPPPPRAPTSPPPSDPTTQPSVRASTDPPSEVAARATYMPYPILPSFRDWYFPHGRLPLEWTSPTMLPPSSAPETNPRSHTRIRRCYLTDLRMGSNCSRLIPSTQSDWVSINGMADYVSTSTGGIDDEANIIRLRRHTCSPATPRTPPPPQRHKLMKQAGADLHLLFN